MSMSDTENPDQTSRETGRQTAVSTGTIVTLIAAVAVATGPVSYTHLTLPTKA